MRTSRIQRLQLVGFILIIILIASCGQTPPASDVLPTTEATVLADDFSKPDANWVRFETDSSAAYVLAGEFYLEDRGQRHAVYAPLLKNDYVDITIDVNVRHVQGSVNNWMGIICRQLDEDNYYLFAISADGYYVILEVRDGISVPLVGPEFSEILNLGKAENSLRVQCRGTQLTLWANKALLEDVTAEGINKAGAVALFADAVQNGEVSVAAFDNFILNSP
ncbi:MAG: hypothetical protein P1S60_09870 [Anaerolineae bacterium]|nr:hypothetical protein [Anaerolineae bacterium]